MEEITSSVVLPVTDAQMTAFSAWVINTYVTYDGFMGSIKSPAIDTYIKTHILPQDMNNVLRRTERFRGEKWGDVNIQWMLLNRRRVTAKINNLKGKIATRTFPIEAAQTRRINREAALSRRRDREEAQLRLDQQMIAYRDAYNLRAREDYDRRLAMERGLFMTPPPKINPPTIVTLTDAADVMEDDCVICLATHKMTDACTISCGHQFGITCLLKWKKDTCPLCRTKITETTVYAAPILLTDIDAVELAAVEVIVA